MPNPSTGSLSRLLGDSSLHWQPIIDLVNEKPVGAEALFRPPEGNPVEWLAWIDQTDQWKEFTRWEMEQVVSDLALFPSLSNPFFAFFNLSPRQCVSSFLFPWVRCFPSHISPVIEVLEKALERSQLSVLARIGGFHDLDPPVSPC
ncbi:hypothetical protein BOX24_05285 [Leptospirillum ferriphilum]|uniref:EAL domain-containing protein n=2 Tax=Leptospirillum ferriphilum TaxID=178606 RepID=A0A1V3SVB4_9BACT|nr:hypothetical protein BOX24_05285 [Leptospirillum ferriphilum]